MSFSPNSGGGNGAISSSSDVVLNTPSDGQTLTYDIAVAKWRNSTPAAGDPVLGGDLSGTATNAQIVDGGVSYANLSTAAVQTLLVNTDAVIRWDGVTGSQPLRSSVTSDVNRRVRWVQPTAPPSTAGYALGGDVWERSV